MINENKLRELFDAATEKYGITLDVTGYIQSPSKSKESLYRWFCLGFAASYQQLLTMRVADPLTPEKREAILKQLKDVHSCRTLIVEPDSRLIFVYSWRSAQQRTMIILADSREEADMIFNDQFDCTTERPRQQHYVTQLFVDGGESTIIYNN